MIYAVHILNGQFIKIGYCGKFVEKRIAGLQTGCPFEIKPLFTVEGTLIQEKELHKTLIKTLALRSIRMPPNEWYLGSHEFFMGFLMNLEESVNIGLAYLDNFDDYDQAAKHHKYEVKLFKYGSKESIEEYLKRGTPMKKPKFVWPNLIEGTKTTRRISMEVVDYFDT